MKDKYCRSCKHYDQWFGDCFAKEDGYGDPLKHGFHGDNFGNSGGLCDLYTPRFEEPHPDNIIYLDDYRKRDD